MHYSLQRDHVHLIVEADDAGSLARGMITTPRETRNALAYVLLNARKHLVQRGVPAGRLRPEPDPASSRSLVRRLARPPARSRRRGPSCVSEARTWLLAMGWRRHGLIDPGEYPGSRKARERARTAP